MGPRAPVSPLKSPWTITDAHFRATCPRAGPGYIRFRVLAGFILDRDEESVQLAVGSQSKRGSGQRSGQRSGQSVLLVFDDKEEVADPVINRMTDVDEIIVWLVDDVIELDI